MKYFILWMHLLMAFLLFSCASPQQMKKITKNYEKTTVLGDYTLGVDGDEAILEKQLPALEYYFALLRENDFLIAKVKSVHSRLLTCPSKDQIPEPKIPKRSLSGQEIGFDAEKDVIIISREHINTAVKQEKDIRNILETDLYKYLTLEKELKCSKKPKEEQD